MKIIYSPILHSKITTREIRCSGCGITVRKGSVHVRTNFGRYCETCADELEFNPLPFTLSSVKLQPAS